LADVPFRLKYTSNSKELSGILPADTSLEEHHAYLEEKYGG
jgi:hypothetical protein